MWGNLIIHLGMPPIITSPFLINDDMIFNMLDQVARSGCLVAGDERKIDGSLTKLFGFDRRCTVTRNQTNGLASPEVNESTQSPNGFPLECVYCLSTMMALAAFYSVGVAQIIALNCRMRPPASRAYFRSREIAAWVGVDYAV